MGVVVESEHQGADLVAALTLSLARIRPFLFVDFFLLLRQEFHVVCLQLLKLFNLSNVVCELVTVISHLLQGLLNILVARLLIFVFLNLVKLVFSTCRVRHYLLIYPVGGLELLDATTLLLVHRLALRANTLVTLVDFLVIPLLLRHVA